MKNALKMILIFFAMVLSFCLTSQLDTSSDIKFESYIQNNQPETTTIVSNSVSVGEIIAKDSRDNINSIGSGSLLSQACLKNNEILKNNIPSFGDSIHKISTNSNQQINIRAP